MEQFLFYFFSFWIIFSSFKVISVTNIVYSVLFLVFSFCNASCLILLLEQEFLGLLLIVVYVGAIAVLFLFVVIILNVKERQPNETVVTGEFYNYLPFNGLFGLSFVCVFSLLLSSNFDKFSNGDSISFLYINWFSNIDSVTNLQQFGFILYSYYFIYFLLAGFVLLIAMIGSVVLVHQPKSSGIRSSLLKRQFVYQQISRDPSKAIFKVN